MWEPLTATGEPLRGPSAHERVERERAAAWSHYGNGGGGAIDYFDGYRWFEMVCRRIGKKATSDVRVGSGPAFSGRGSWRLIAQLLPYDRSHSYGDGRGRGARAQVEATA